MRSPPDFPSAGTFPTAGYPQHWDWTQLALAFRFSRLMLYRPVVAVMVVFTVVQSVMNAVYRTGFPVLTFFAVVMPFYLIMAIIFTHLFSREISRSHAPIAPFARLSQKVKWVSNVSALLWLATVVAQATFLVTAMFSEEGEEARVLMALELVSSIVYWPCVLVCISYTAVVCHQTSRGVRALRKGLPELDSAEELHAVLKALRCSLEERGRGLRYFYLFSALNVLFLESSLLYTVFLAHIQLYRDSTPMFIFQLIILPLGFFVILVFAMRVNKQLRKLNVLCSTPNQLRIDDEDLAQFSLWLAIDPLAFSFFGLTVDGGLLARVCGAVLSSAFIALMRVLTQP